jgi:hypothetical protein
LRTASAGSKEPSKARHLWKIGGSLHLLAAELERATELERAIAASRTEKEPRQLAAFVFI